MATLKEHRRRHGLSQRELARRANVAYKTIQLIEAGGHDARWSTLNRLAVALGLPDARSLGEPRRRRTNLTAADVARLIGAGGEEAWESWLPQFVDDFRRAPTPRSVAQAPDAGTDGRTLALLASTVEALCAERGIPAPWWCAGAPALEEPWFVSGIENLKASALVESPSTFRQRNVFVLGNFLSRA